MRTFIIVLDSLGVGALPDATKFKQSTGDTDEGANTLKHIIEKNNGINAPHFQKLGLANVFVTKDNPNGLNLWPASKDVLASYGIMAEQSAGKDTSSGHWELAGCPVPYEMPVFYDGLPQEMLDRFIKRIEDARMVIPGLLGGGKPASGTEIIKELGEEHVKTGKPIVYTSMDSVFQIAAHEEAFGLDKLYKISEIARSMLNEYDDKIGRVIARPFVGTNTNNFERTPNRKDYSLEPHAHTVLDKAKESNLDVISVGKIADIFAQRGITKKIKSKSNEEGMQAMIDLARDSAWRGIAFANLVDFDMLYGHRRNALGYLQAIEKVDGMLPEFLSHLTKNDLLIITADHGCDPTFKGTDHTREYVPVLVYQKDKPAKNLGTRKCFADVAATVAKFLDLPYATVGESMI